MRALTTRFFFAAVLVAPAGLSAQAATSCLSALDGHWRGAGSIMNRNVIMEQRWAPALGGNFRELTMRHLSAKDSATVQFEGRGLYTGAKSGPNAIAGMWFDARGMMLPVAGQCEGKVFISDWGSADTEQGRTVYTLVSPTSLQVIDSVQLRDGTRREFGRSQLTRQ